MDLADRTATWVLDEAAAGRLATEDYLEACLERIATREPELRAWSLLDTAAARRAAQAAARRRGPLAGLPLGVKDVFDTADWPTACGSPLHAGRQPTLDAAAVALARAAGCVLPGKTVTTEFAYFHPGPTGNPHDSAHTPGGSSSGSAAAVGAGMVPFALGTQTAGSVIRPAAYCGVVGFKPSYGAISTAGVKQLAWSLDTVGLFARSVADAALLAEALSGQALRPGAAPATPRIGLCRTPQWAAASPEVQAQVEAAARAAAAAGAEVRETALPPACAELLEDQKLIMAFEAARALAPERSHGESQMSAAILALMDAGLAVSGEAYLAARARSRAARRALDGLFAEVDLLLTPAAPGEAPRGLEATGDPLFNRVWTLLGTPCLSLPAGRGPAGLPLAVQLVGPSDGDAGLLAAAAWLAPLLA